MAAITSDTTLTMADGSTIQTVVYSDGGRSVTYVPGTGAPAANQQTLLAKAPAAFAANAIYLAIPSPTAAQAIPQVEKLTRQVNALMKLTQGLLSDTTGT